MQPLHHKHSIAIAFDCCEEEYVSRRNVRKGKSACLTYRRRLLCLRLTVQDVRPEQIADLLETACHVRVSHAHARVTTKAGTHLEIVHHVECRAASRTFVRGSAPTQAIKTAEQGIHLKSPLYTR